MYTLITPKKTLGAEPNFDVGARQNLAVLKYILTLSNCPISPAPCIYLHIDISMHYINSISIGFIKKKKLDAAAGYNESM